MFFREALAECLAYIRLHPAPYSEAELRSGVPLPWHDMDAWGAILEAAASARALRSAALAPQAAFLVERFDLVVLDLEAVDWGHAFERFTIARRAFLHNTPGTVTPTVTPEDFWAARCGAHDTHALLVFDPGMTLSDGAARVASNGYFDLNNIPPCDTWVALLPPTADAGATPRLLCWGPDWARRLAEDGISVNPEGCLSWVSAEGDTPPVQEQRERWWP